MPPSADPFASSLVEAAPPRDWPLPAAALWWDAKGDWTKAHDLVATDEEGREAAWVHAYLHRKEGDIDNARYWYDRARRPVSAAPLDDERGLMIRALLDPTPGD